MKTQCREQTFDIETFTTNNVKFTLKPDQNVADGNWYIDSLLPVSVKNVTESEGLSVEKFLSDGDHTVTFTGMNGRGDSFTYSKVFSVDTTPPRLMLTSPINGSFFSETGKLKVSGITDTAALFTIDVDGQTAVFRKTLAELGCSVGADGTFSFDLQTDPGVSSHEVEITVEDAAGNSSKETVKVMNAGLSNITSLRIMKDGVLYSENNLVLNESAETAGKLSLAATTGNGSTFVINDGSMVSWSAAAKEGGAAVDREGAFTASPGSVGFVTAYFHVADGADMTAAITFGAEKFNNPNDGSCRLTLANTVGGAATGGGYYFAGASVALKAVPGSGYYFAGWSSSNGGSFANAGSESTTFTMPAGNTVVTAAFAPYATAVDANIIKKGTEIEIALPAEMLGNSSSVVPYYILNGKKHYVTNSAVVDGKLVFIAPVTGEFRYEINKTKFDDTSDHWAQRYIEFTSARGLLEGVGEGKFDPDGSMTRAMLVTILARLDSADLTKYKNTAFKDVKAGSWYDSAVAWALEAGIAGGLSKTEYAPDAPITREQMAVMLANYIKYKGYKLDSAGTNPAEFADGGLISKWAADAVSLIQSLGIVEGRSGNLFDPTGATTRAEGCAVLERLIEAILKK